MYAIRSYYEIRVTISAQACLLILGLPHNYYENVLSIIVYPSTVVPPPRTPGFFENTVAPVERAQPILGQAFLRGPVIVVWDAARITSYNVCYTKLLRLRGDIMCSKRSNLQQCTQSYLEQKSTYSIKPILKWPVAFEILQ